MGASLSVLVYVGVRTCQVGNVDGTTRNRLNENAKGRTHKTRKTGERLVQSPHILQEGMNLGEAKLGVNGRLRRKFQFMEGIEEGIDLDITNAAGSWAGDLVRHLPEGDV